MIIYGTRGITYNKAKGRFFCPRCGKCSYKHVRVRRFFTLYFIPLIPLDLLGEYVECGHCESTYKPDVLSYDPQEDGQQLPEAEFHTAIRRVMIMMMLADGVIEDDELQTICGLYGALSGGEITEQAVRAEATELEGHALHAAINPLVGSLNDSGKELVIKAAYMVAMSDGEFPEEERVLLANIAKALEVPNAKFKELLDSLMQEQPLQQAQG